MVLDELVTYLASLSGLQLIPATNLFYSMMPDSPDSCVALFEYPGMPMEPVLGGTTPRLQYPSVQVVVRGSDERSDDYIDPRTLARDIYLALVEIGDQDLGSVRYLAVMPKQEPFFLRRDENFRVHIACNYQVIKDPS